MKNMNRRQFLAALGAGVVLPSALRGGSLTDFLKEQRNDPSIHDYRFARSIDLNDWVEMEHLGRNKVVVRLKDEENLDEETARQLRQNLGHNMFRSELKRIEGLSDLNYFQIDRSPESLTQIDGRNFSYNAELANMLASGTDTFYMKELVRANPFGSNFAVSPDLEKITVVANRPFEVDIRTQEHKTKRLKGLKHQYQNHAGLGFTIRPEQKDVKLDESGLTTASTDISGVVDSILTGIPTSLLVSSIVNPTAGVLTLGYNVANGLFGLAESYHRDTNKLSDFEALKADGRVLYDVTGKKPVKIDGVVEKLAPDFKAYDGGTIIPFNYEVAGQPLSGFIALTAQDKRYGPQPLVAKTDRVTPVSGYMMPKSVKQSDESQAEALTIGLTRTYSGPESLRWVSSLLLTGAIAETVRYQVERNNSCDYTIIGDDGSIGFGGG